jgi:lipoprotein-anchoring transpeptidase ErfK/SrfK
MRIVLTTLLASALAGPAVAEPLALFRNQPAPAPASQSAPASGPVQVASSEGRNLGGGFVEFLFGGGGSSSRPRYPADPAYATDPSYIRVPGQPGPEAQQPLDPKYERQAVGYDGKEAPGTVIIDTPQRFLYLVQGDGKALRYGIGVGRPGFTWAGVKTVSMKREWPDWRPPKEMLQRRPDLPHYMAGGPENPLGARAMYLGSTLYRIHGSNEPWTIGTQVSSGCIRMRNEDVIDLYERVKVGTKVVVI